MRNSQNGKYVWGLFYYNPLDSLFFVKKRNGLGWTINFAHKRGIVALALVIVAIIYISR